MKVQHSTLHRTDTARRMGSIVLLLGIFSLLQGCIYPYEADLKDAGPVLVIEGDLSIGNYTTFYLTSMDRFSGQDGEMVDEVKAQVEDENGNVLAESNVGPSPSGYSFVSRGYAQLDTRNLPDDGKYRIRFNISSGSFAGEYVTPLMECTAPPVIDSISFHVPPRDSEDRNMYVGLSFHSDKGMTLPYYNVRFEETWRFSSLVDTEAWYDPDYNTVNEFGWDNPQRICWRSRGPLASVITTENLKDDRIVNYPIIYINESERKISDTYKVTVHVTSIPEDTYRYWNSLNEVSQVNGDLFSPIPSSVRGNITKVGDPKAMVLGNIGVSKESSLTRYVSSSQLKFYRPDRYDSSRVEEAVNEDPEIIGDPSKWRELWLAGYWPYEAVYSNTTGRYLYHTWILHWCLECTYMGGTTTMPQDWNPVFN